MGIYLFCFINPPEIETGYCSSFVNGENLLRQAVGKPYIITLILMILSLY